MERSLGGFFLLCWAATSYITVAGSFAQKPTVYQGKEEKLPREVGPQPIAFSHKQHMSAGLACLVCHMDAEKKDQAGLPTVEQCAVCHTSSFPSSSQRPHPAAGGELKKLAEIRSRKERVKWVRVYRVPDIVFFSHRNHLKAGEKCVTCHGPVASRHVLAQEVSTSMTTCMNCHMSRRVPNECYLCHDLGQ